MYQKYIKRLLDATVAAFACVLLSPILFIVAVMVGLKLGRPILFKQQRPGKDEKIFTLYKFRTMRDATDKNGSPLPDKERLTSFGKLLRSTSLDELPELWNIFRGDMSFVGPRPLRVEYITLYSKNQRKRHDVLPGLTGLAQVSGRNSIDWPTRLAYDIEYVKTVSICKDLHILLNTLGVVFKRSGISNDEHATMEPFKGER